MNPMNNPVMQLVTAIRGGGNPIALAQQLAMQNPQVNTAVHMLSGKNTQQIEQMVRNMCAQRGTTPEELARSVGIALPSSK